MPYLHKEADVNAPLEKFTGNYMMPLTHPPYMTNFPIEIIVRDNNLYIHGPGVPDVQLKSESETNFFYGDGTDQQIQFEKDSDNNNIKVFYIGYGVKKEIKKID